MKTQKFTISNALGEKLVGIKAIPDFKKEKYPAMVLVHGFNSDKIGSGFTPLLAQTLVQHGILAYSFDFSGCGESEGDFVNVTLTKEAIELKKILDFVKGEKDIDPKRIGIFANSFGTAAAITLKPIVNAMVLAGTTDNFYEVIKKGCKDNFNPGEISTRLKSNGKITRIGPQFWEDLKQHDLIEDVKKINIPILFLHGQKDDTVPIGGMEKLLNAANEPKEKYILKDSDHKLNPRRKEAVQVITKWLKRKLK